MLNLFPQIATASFEFTYNFFPTTHTNVNVMQKNFQFHRICQDFVYFETIRILNFLMQIKSVGIMLVQKELTVGIYFRNIPLLNLGICVIL